MGWLTDDGRHEGYLAPMFGDGQRGHGVTASFVPADRVVVGGAGVQREDGSWAWPTRPAGEVTGWVVCCDCYRNTSFGAASSWIGPAFTRVPSTTLENLTARRIFAADDQVADVSERPDVHDAAVGLWRSEHAFGVDALTEVQAAATAAAQAELRPRRSGRARPILGHQLGRHRPLSRDDPTVSPGTLAQRRRRSHQQRDMTSSCSRRRAGYPLSQGSHAARRRQLRCSVRVSRPPGRRSAQDPPQRHDECRILANVANVANVAMSPTPVSEDLFHVVVYFGVVNGHLPGYLCLIQ